jgi:HrpA-like RNA helicase
MTTPAPARRGLAVHERTAAVCKDCRREVAAGLNPAELERQYLERQTRAVGHDEDAAAYWQGLLDPDDEQTARELEFTLEADGAARVAGDERSRLVWSATTPSGADEAETEPTADPAGFEYSEGWARSVLERGGSRSDRCPRHRAEHNRKRQASAVPYIDVDVIGRVAEPSRPAGPLGGLGPLPVEHVRARVVSDLDRFEFGLTDGHVLELLKALTDTDKQVAVVIARTGSGKSTFLPYRLLVPPDGAPLRLADIGPIVVTEPRTAAAVENAHFVAEQLHQSRVGAGHDIGYRTNAKQAYDASCRLLYVTDGSLVNWLADGRLHRYSTVIVDEAHERSIQIDATLMFLRQQLPQHPHLRVLVVSATINAGTFVEFFGGPDRVHVLDISDDDAEVWGYGEPLWPGREPNLAAWREHGPDGEPLRELTLALAGLRTRATELPTGTGYTTWRRQMPREVVRQALAIIDAGVEGDILAFLPGRREIHWTVEQLQASLRQRDRSDVVVWPLMRSVPPSQQQLARRPDPRGRRRVLIASNIAETSLTIIGLRFVIDSGLINQTEWDLSAARQRVAATGHSQDGLRQRWGRVGRRTPGWVFPLYTKEQFDTLPRHTPPESARANLEDTVLIAKRAGLGNLTKIAWPATFHTLPDTGVRDAVADAGGGGSRSDTDAAALQAELQRAEAALRDKQALDQHGELTFYGEELSYFAGGAEEAAALALADQLACSLEVAVALALLNGRRLTGGAQGLLPIDPRWSALHRHRASLAHAATLQGCTDDLEVALKVFAGWSSAPDRASWAQRHWVNHQRLTQAAKAAEQLLLALTPGRKKAVTLTARPELAPRVRRTLAASLGELRFRRSPTGDGWYSTVDATDLSITWLLDPLARLPDDTGELLAFRRGDYSGARQLGNLVALSSSSHPAGQTAKASAANGNPTNRWLQLAWESAHDRAPDGQLPAQGSASQHYALTAQYPLGSVLTGAAVEGAEAQWELSDVQPPDESWLLPLGDQTSSGLPARSNAADRRPVQASQQRSYGVPAEQPGPKESELDTSEDPDPETAADLLATSDRAEAAGLAVLDDDVELGDDDQDRLVDPTEDGLDDEVDYQPPIGPAPPGPTTRADRQAMPTAGPQLFESVTPVQPARQHRVPILLERRSSQPSDRLRVVGYSGVGGQRALVCEPAGQLRSGQRRGRPFPWDDDLHDRDRTRRSMGERAACRSIRRRSPGHPRTSRTQPQPT